MSVQRDIDAELRFHFDARIAELTSQGLSTDDARARAAAEFGDVDAVRAGLRAIDDRVARRRNRIELFDGFRHDISYAIRSLRRTPAVAITIVLTLALGLGANAAMFSLLDVIFLRAPAAVAHPNDLRRLWVLHHYSSADGSFGSGFDYRSYSAAAAAVEGRAAITIYGVPSRKKLGRGENAPRVTMSGAAANYFSLLGVKPQIGRFYDASEDRVETPTPVAVISDALWKRELGGAPSVIGRVILLANQRLTVIGVAPPQFSGTELDATDVWTPMATSIATRSIGKTLWWQSHNINGFQILVRPNPGAREVDLLGQLTVAMRGPDVTFTQDTLAIAAFGSIVAANGPGDSKTEMKVATRLAGVAVIVLLIACANVINLLLGRAVQRRREIAVRLALGVSRTRLVRMLVTESLLLALVAAVAAIVVATWGGSMLFHLLMPEIHFADAPPDWRMLTFALVLSATVGALAGLVPALRFSSPNLTRTLRSGARDGGAYRSRLRDALVMLQAAFSVLLLVGAVLFVRSLENAKARDIGLSVDQLVFGTVSYDTRDSARDAATSGQLQSLTPRVAALPGVQRVAFTSLRPTWGMSWISDWVPDYDTTGKKMPTGFFTAVSPDYFNTIGTRLIAGHTFDVAPAHNAPPTVIVNQAMANALWPNQNAIGHCIRFEGPSSPCAPVIGVAQTAFMTSLDETPRTQFYLSLATPPTKVNGAEDVIVRTSSERIPEITRSLRALLAAEFPGSIPSIVTMSEAMEPQYRPWRLGATLFTLFGVLALVVAAIGIYSTVTYAVSQRTHEFGVRVALGARASDVLRQVISEGLRPVAIGVVIGILMTLAAGRLVTTLLYGIAPSDPAAMAIVAVILLAIAGLAALVPASRAARVDPIGALRAD